MTFSKAPHRATKRGAGDRGPRDRGGRDRSGCDEGADTRDSKRCDAEQRADTRARGDLADEFLRIVASAIGRHGLAVVLRDDRNRGVVHACATKVGDGALRVGVRVENRGYQVRAHHRSSRNRGADGPKSHATGRSFPKMRVSGAVT